MGLRDYDVSAHKSLIRCLPETGCHDRRLLGAPLNAIGLPASGHCQPTSSGHWTKPLASGSSALSYYRRSLQRAGFTPHWGDVAIYGKLSKPDSDLAQQLVQAIKNKI